MLQVHVCRERERERALYGECHLRQCTVWDLLSERWEYSSIPCSLFSVSQNFCNSEKYLSRMNTLERPRVVAIAVVDEDIAVALIYVLRSTVATITDPLITGDSYQYETTGAGGVGRKS